MWAELIKGIVGAGIEIYEAVTGAREEEQQHAYEFMTAKIGEMRAYGADLKDRILARNAEFLARAVKQAAELANDDEG